MKRSGKWWSMELKLGEDLRRKCVERKREGDVERMDERLIDMINDERKKDVIEVEKEIEVKLDGLGKIGVEKKRVIEEKSVDMEGIVVRIFGIDVLR